MPTTNSAATRRGVIAVIRRDAMFLVIRRALTESAPGKICFPGGGIETGESESQALVREVEEEVGIQGAVPVRRLWENQTPSGIQLGWWETKISHGAIPVPNIQEVSEFFWWTEAQMRSCDDLLPTNLAFLDFLAT